MKYRVLAVAVWAVGAAAVFGLTVLFQHLGWYPH